MFAAPRLAFEGCVFVLTASRGQIDTDVVVLYGMFRIFIVSSYACHVAPTSVVDGYLYPPASHSMDFYGVATR